MHTRPILCATDFSEGARRALDLACALALAANRELLLVHAWPPGAEPEGELTERMEHERERAQRTGARCRSMHIEGTPWEAIAAAAEEHDAELIVVGPHGRGHARRVSNTVREWLVGSTADRLMQRAPRPVMVASSNLSAPPELHSRPWLVGIDFSAPSIAAIDRVRPLATATGGQLVLIHVVAPAGTDELTADPDWERQFEQSTQSRLADLAREHAPGAEILLWEALARPSEGLCAAAQQRNAAMVVLGTHGRRGVRRLVVGSSAEQCLRRCPVPVLVVRHDQLDPQ